MASDTEPSLYQLLILRGLQDKPMYEGTVPAKTVAIRRAKNKVARASRRQNRSGK